MSQLEEKFLEQLRSACLPEPVREYRFAPGKMWRFDFAWSEYDLAVEIEGGIYARGRHTRGSSFESDASKYNAAAILGWTVLRFGPNQVNGRGRKPNKIYEGINTLKEAISVKMAIDLEIRKIVLEESDTSYTGWTMKMNNGDGVPASLGEIELWKIVRKQATEIVALRGRVSQLEANQSIKGVAHERIAK